MQVGEEDRAVLTVGWVVVFVRRGQVVPRRFHMVSVLRGSVAFALLPDQPNRKGPRLRDNP